MKKPKQPKIALEEADAPFLAQKGDPGFKELDRGNTRKYLTKLKRPAIMGSVNKLKVERTKSMATDKQKTKNGKLRYVKATAWTIEAAARIFTGWLVLSNFNNYLAVAVAFYMLGTGLVIVGAHIINAHK